MGRYRIIKNKRCEDVWFHIEQWWPIFGWKKMQFDCAANYFLDERNAKEIVCAWTSPTVIEVVYESPPPQQESEAEK